METYFQTSYETPRTKRVISLFKLLNKYVHKSFVMSFVSEGYYYLNMNSEGVDLRGGGGYSRPELHM